MTSVDGALDLGPCVRIVEQSVEVPFYCEARRIIGRRVYRCAHDGRRMLVSETIDGPLPADDIVAKIDVILAGRGIPRQLKEQEFWPCKPVKL